MWQSKKRMLRDWESEIALIGVMSDQSRRACCAAAGTCWFRSERLLRLHCAAGGRAEPKPCACLCWGVNGAAACTAQPAAGPRAFPRHQLTPAAGPRHSVDGAAARWDGAVQRGNRGGGSGGCGDGGGGGGVRAAWRGGRAESRAAACGGGWGCWDGAQGMVGEGAGAWAAVARGLRESGRPGLEAEAGDVAKQAQ